MYSFYLSIKAPQPILGKHFTQSTGSRHHILTPHTQSLSTLPPLVFVSDLKNKWHLVVDRLTVLFLKFLEYFHKLQLFVWWLLEIHIIKIVSSYIVLVAVKEVRRTCHGFQADA